ncbi:MAG: hypothetical protein ACYC8W_04865 [Candidatus Tyrphobacter sp.]
MKQLYVGFGALVVAAGLAACGGGGSGGGGGSLPPPGPHTTPQAATYSGTETIANVYNGYPCGAACGGDPNATPYPNTSVSYSLSDSVTSVTGSGAVVADETLTEPNQNLTATLTTFVTPSPNGAVTNVAETRTVYADSDGYSQNITYPTPLVVDQEPENNGANWTNGATANLTETYNDGTNDARTTNSDGSYSENEVNNGTFINDTATVNADASATWIAAPGSYGLTFGYICEYTISAPSGGFVTWNAYNYNSCPPASPAQTINIAQWFSTTPLTLASNGSTITTGVSFPGGCRVPATYGTTGNKIHTVVSDLDPLFGFTEQTTTDAYTSTTYGLVCVQSTDVLDTYYEWNLSNRYYPFVSSTPLIVTTTTSTLTLQSGKGVGVLSHGSSTSVSTQSVGNSVSASVNAAVLARALVRVQTTRLRAQAKERVLHTIMSHRAGGAVR